MEWDGAEVTLYLDPRLDKRAFQEARDWCREQQLQKERAEALQKQARLLRGKKVPVASTPQADFGDLFDMED